MACWFANCSWHDVLHHDLRSANVLMGPKDECRCRITDFGLSKTKLQSKLVADSARRQQAILDGALLARLHSLLPVMCLVLVSYCLRFALILLEHRRLKDSLGTTFGVFTWKGKDH